MKKVIALSLIILFKIGTAQTTKTTYYDLKKTKKKEVYQTDANGTVNGSYKNYDEDGAIANEGTFKFGKKNGAFIEYTKYANYAGKMQIKSKETYVNDLKEGPATYYMYRDELGVYELQTGIYSQNKEEGVWAKIYPVTDNISAPTYEEKQKMVNEIVNNAIYKNSMGIKSFKKYQAGQVVNFNDTTVNEYYFPSGKIYSTITWKDGKKESEKYFYPDGKSKISGYSYDGTPDFYTQKALDMEKKDNDTRKVAADKLNQAVVDANKDVSSGNFEEGLKKMNFAINNYIQWRDNTYTFAKKETEELKAALSLQSSLIESKNNESVTKAKALIISAKTKLFSKDSYGASDTYGASGYLNQAFTAIDNKSTLPIYQNLQSLMILIKIVKSLQDGMYGKSSYDDAIRDFKYLKNQSKTLEGIFKDDLSELLSKGAIKQDAYNKILIDGNIK